MKNPIKALWDVCYDMAGAIIKHYSHTLPTKYLLADAHRIPEGDISIVEDSKTGHLVVTLEGEALKALKKISELGSEDVGASFRRALGTQMYFAENEGQIKRSYTSKPNGPFGIGEITRDFIVP